MKITKKFFLNLTLMTMSFFGLFAATYSWFNAKRQVDPELGSIQVNTSDIESIEYCFIKHDGTYLRNQDDTSTVLNMDPYDPVIVSKNENSHILLQMKLTLHESEVSRNLSFSVSTEKESFGNPTTTGTNFFLSDGIDISILDLTGSNINTQQDLAQLFSTVTEQFKGASSLQKSAFVDANASFQKSAKIDLPLIEIGQNTTTAYVYFNFEYNQTLMKEIINRSSGTGGTQNQAVLGYDILLPSDLTIHASVIESGGNL